MNLRVWLLRFWRLSVLAGALTLIRCQGPGHDTSEPLGLDTARIWFPGAAHLSRPDGETGVQYVTDDFGDLLGMLLQTMPRARDIVGYSGPSNTLVALDRGGKVLGAKLRWSADTADHVRRVVQDDGFWQQMRPFEEDQTIRQVSGATLTSSAITRGILKALGRTERASLLFPYPIELRELQSLFPTAQSIEPDPSPLGGVILTDANGTTLARILRTSPASDAVTGYKGPTDSLVILDPKGEMIRGIQVRDSYETEEYLAIVTKDSRFLPGFSGRSVREMRDFDFQSAGVSGVSGATRTSLAVLEGVRRRLRADEGPSPVPRFPFRLHDGILIALVGFAIFLSFSPWRGHRSVRLVWNAILILYLGLLSGDLLSQSLLAGWAANDLAWRSLPGMAFLAAASLLVPLFTGRQLYCHHLCPHGAAQQWLGKLTRKKVTLPESWQRWMARLPFFLLLTLFLTVVAGLKPNLAAFEPFDAWVFRASGLASIVIAIIGLLASVFHPLAYCKFGCPTGALLRFLRTGASSDRFSGRDWMALGLLATGTVLTVWG